MKRKMEKKLLELIEGNCHLSNADIAKMLDIDEKDVAEKVKELEKNNTIVAYTGLINWDKMDVDKVTAIIEVKVTPARGEGFDKIAERIYRFSEVSACYLMSGGFDLTVIVEGRTMKEVALFVAMKLSPLESVMSTATHFILKKYKDRNIVFEEKKRDERIKISL